MIHENVRLSQREKKKKGEAVPHEIGSRCRPHPTIRRYGCQKKKKKRKGSRRSSSLEGGGEKEERETFPRL